MGGCGRNRAIREKENKRNIRSERTERDRKRKDRIMDRTQTRQKIIDRPSSVRDRRGNTVI